MSGPISISRRLPAFGDSPDYGCALYPDPPSHDFCVWLVIAELMRRHHYAPAPLKVRFGLIDGQLGKVDFGPYSLLDGRFYQCGLSRDYSDHMMVNVLRPAIEMIGAVEAPAVNLPFPASQADELRRYVEYDYHIGHLVDEGWHGHQIPRWKPPGWAFAEVDEHLSGRTPVVITLRETGAQPERNSRINDWLRFATSIEADHDVLFLRDTCQAESRMPFPTWPRASRNAYVRAALYQRALVNMMVCNGPNTWCIFSDAPYLIFKELVPELPTWDHGQPRGWKEQDHMDVGDQYPWAAATQRLTWTDDKFEDIRSAFDALMPLIGKERAKSFT